MMMVVMVPPAPMMVMMMVISREFDVCLVLAIASRLLFSFLGRV
jgi:hypothetical protein